MNLDVRAMLLFLPKFGKDETEPFAVDHAIDFKVSVRWSASIAKNGSR
jgi:hypothetical protein